MSDFVLSSVPPFLDGVYLGINAVTDAYLLIDCPSGCFGKCERIALNHDVTSTLFDPMGLHRIVQSGVDFAELTLGSERVLDKLVRRMVDEASPRAVVVTQATSALVTSNDLLAFCERHTEEQGIPFVYLPPETLEGDYLDGYAAFVRALVAASERSAARSASASGDVGIVGYFSDRLEQDHKASLAELDRLIRGLGAEPAGVMCGGGSVDEAADALRARVLVELPYARGTAAPVAEQTGAEVLPVPLPVGVGATVDLLERLGASLGKSAEAEAFIRAELEPLISVLDLSRERFLEHRAVAIAADPHLCAALLRFYAELGMRIPLVCLHTRHEEHAADLARVAQGAGVEPRITYDLGPTELKAALTELGGDRDIDLLVGASPDRDVAADLGLGFVELGYPSFLVHALYPRPLFGFAGARRIADDLVNALQLVDYERNRAKDPVKLPVQT